MGAVELFSDPSLINEIPTETGVYIIRSRYDEVLYIGKAKNLRNRLRSYLKLDSLDFMKQSMVREAKSVETITTNSEWEALLLESNLIKEERPPYNIVLRDDKSYPYLRISLSEKFPRLSMARRIKHKGDFYFGPITPVEKLKTLIKTLKEAYRIAQKNDSSCQRSSHYCIYYQMDKCSAPCVGLISREEYMEMIYEIKDILTNPRKLKEKITKELNSLVQMEKFEEAIKLREKLKAIGLLENKQSVSELNEYFSDVVVFTEENNILCSYILSIRFSNITGSRKFFFYNTTINKELMEGFLLQYYSRDIVPDRIIMYPAINAEALEKVISREKKVKLVFPKRGQGKKLIDIAMKNAKLSLKQEVLSTKRNIEVLETLRDILTIKHRIRVVDVIDVSHTSFENVVAGVIRYGIHGFDKHMYRRYKLESKFEKETMEEVSERHMKLLRKSKLIVPDLFVVDGGPIQAEVVRKKTSIPTIGIAKEKLGNKAIRSKGDVMDIIYYKNSCIDIPHEVLMFLQKLRDEAHRFALFYHRKKRTQYVKASILDRIEFIGERRKRALFERFETIDNMRRASLEELSSVKGITPKIAKLIKEKLNSPE